MASRTLAGRYRLQEPLGTSLMAEVHTAMDPVLDRVVVVKLLAAQADRARFEREARAAAALAHVNIVKLFDYGEDEGRPYMVFEYLPGESLAQRLAAGRPLPDEETTRIAGDLAAGLAHAHEHGVVHRDLKPGNVLFDAEDRAKIADFGIAQVADADTITDAGTVLGTAAYISPEQVRGEPVTPASDVYSFGVVLYQMLSGRLPFQSESPGQLAAMHRDLEPPRLGSVRPDAPAALATLAAAALAKNPDSRPPDGAALVGALSTGAPPVDLADQETEVLATTPVRRGRTRRPLLIGFALAAILTAGFVTAALLIGRGHPAPAVPLQTSRSSSTQAEASTPATSSITSSSSSVEATTRRSTTVAPRESSTETLPPPPTETTAPPTDTTEPTTTVP
jgi:serine/threonine protein kinase